MPNVGPDDPYLSRVMDAVSKGLAVFSVGMAVVSLILNPVTINVAAVTGAASLGLGIARREIFKKH